MAVNATSSILGQYEASQGNTNAVATDKDTFLKLLVAQLTHQDPLNPVEDKEFIAQLAQFTQVEELQNISGGIETLNASYLAQQSTNAASLIGMEVLAGGDNIYLRDAGSFASSDDYPMIYFTLPEQSAGGMFTVYSTNPDGSIGSLVYSETMGSYSEGRHPAKWHGQNQAGEVMPNGSYIINITAVDADGKDLYVTKSSYGLVSGVGVSEDGQHELYLYDSRTVNFTDVQLITYSSYGNGGGGGTSGDETTGDETSDDETSGDNDSTP